MQAWSLTLDKILIHAGRRCGDRAVVSRDSIGAIHVCDYRALLAASYAFSAALTGQGVVAGDRIATLMWNDVEHLAAWYGAMGIGAVVHTINPRLHLDRIAWIARHGGARILVVEEEFRHLAEAIVGRASAIDLVVISTLKERVAGIGNVRTVTLSDFVSAGGSADWGAFDEESAAGLCYTSGTTGDPKGVLYSHRSNFLHALAVNQPNGLAIGADDVVLPVVPMFHANAWALAFVAPMAGAELVLPGRHLDGQSLIELITGRGVTVAVGVPTIWEELLKELTRSGRRLPSLRRLVVGGSAVPLSIIRRFAEEHEVEVVHAWGMTEMSPLGTMTSAVPGSVAGAGDRWARTLRQGASLFPVEIEVFDAEGRPCDHDDNSPGALRARGPTVARAYFGVQESLVDAAGWFDTGDVAVIDRAGSMRIVDRAKDVIKSGGEWISSIEIENIAVAHPDVRRAAVIGVEDAKWGERPLLVVEPSGERRPSPDELREHLGPSIPKWWLPSLFAYCDVPLGATGKIDKMALRRRFASPDAPEVVGSAEPGVAPVSNAQSNSAEAR